MTAVEMLLSIMEHYHGQIDKCLEYRLILKPLCFNLNGLRLQAEDVVYMGFTKRQS